jgi:tetratricopeptide (TPR) repeat protein
VMAFRPLRSACPSCGTTSCATALCAAVVCAATLLFAAPSPAATPPNPDDCHALQKHGHADEAQKCYQALTETVNPYLRAEGFWGLEMFMQANDAFRTALVDSPNNAMYRVRWGRLLHERFNNSDAEDLFDEALMKDPKNAQAYLGKALVSADGFDNKALQWAKKALELDPNLMEAHELMANLELEDSHPDQAVQEADAALKISSEALDAMAIHAAVEVLADRSPDEWLNKVLHVNAMYGEAYAMVGYHLVINRRYQEGIDYYRKAIALNPRDWSAHSELGINLMRLGQEEEPLKELQISYNNGYRNAETVNSLRLLDSYKNFVTFRDATTIIRLNKKEADLLHPYVDDVLKRAIATYSAKYKMTLPAPVQVEVYPDHEDFAVRTMGLPGLGALGVTFGEVVAMDSPSGRPPGDFQWASTLWHEMSHVFILTATNHRVPRWFTEGLAVHEETEANPEWGDRITPDIVSALRDKRLLPVSDMDRGFIRPEYSAQVLVSYYQAGRICDYIKERWGADKLLDMVHSFAQLKTTPEVIQQDLRMSPEDFDKQFQEWLYKDVGSTVNNFGMWTTSLKELSELAKAHNDDAVLQKGDAVIAMYPDYVYTANAYEFMAAADLNKGNKDAAAAVLTAYEKKGGRDPDALKKLATLEEEAGKLKDAAETLDRINYIYPSNDEELHRHLGNLWFDQKNYAGAIREYSAVAALNPLDKASAQFNLARAYSAAGQQDKAREYVLNSLEAAPDFRPAQKLLLELEDSQKGK